APTLVVSVFPKLPISQMKLRLLAAGIRSRAKGRSRAFAAVRAGRNLMKSILKTCTALSLVLAYGAQATAQEMLQALGPAEGEVSIVAWPGYIERGETDAAFDWVTKFEEATGCRVAVKTANTSDEMVALMNEGGFDLVTA